MKVRRFPRSDSNISSIQSYYVHKKFGYIKIEKTGNEYQQDSVGFKEEEPDPKAVKILDMLVLNPAKDTQSLKLPPRKTKVVKIAPYQPKLQQTFATQYPNIKRTMASIEDKIVKPSLPHIVTSNHTSYPVQTAQLAYLMQPLQAPSAFTTPTNNCFQRTSPTPFGLHSNGFLTHVPATLSITAPVVKPLQHFEPMYYTRLLQLQLNAKTKRPNFLESRQTFREMQSVPS